MEEPGRPTAALSEIVTAWLHLIREGRKDECPLEGTALDLADALEPGQTWASGRVRFPVHTSVFGRGTQDAEILSPTVDQAETTEGPADPVEEVQFAPFKSKFLHIFPLYQGYCQRAVQDRSESECCAFDSITPGHLLTLGSPRFKAKLQVTVPSPPTPRVHRDTLSTFWQDLYEVKECGILDMLSPREVNRQETMFEVIGSEASYLRSLHVAVNHFSASKMLSGTVSRLEHHILFSTLHHVMSASEEFLMALECVLGECVLMPHLEDLLLRRCPSFRAVYVPYLSNMMFQEALFNKLQQENKRFASAVKTLESDPICQRQSLKSFLGLPFQRITRLKLLMENVLRLTDPDADSYLNLKKTIEALHKVIMECNEGVKRMKQIEELVCLEMLLDFSNVKLLPLIVKGRFLLHEGPLRRLTEVGADLKISFIDVYLHLFNDLVVISRRKEQRFRVLDYASFPTGVRVEQLNASMLGLPADAFLLHLSQNHAGQATTLILTAPRSEKVAWMTALSAEN